VNDMIYAKLQELLSEHPQARQNQDFVVQLEKALKTFAPDISLNGNVPEK